MKKGSAFSFYYKADKENFLENLTMLLGAGLNILSAIEAIKTECRSAKMIRLIKGVQTYIEEGDALWQALEKVKIFPTQAISLVKIGEKSGRLVENLQVVASQQQKDRQFKSKIRSAVMYPAFVLGTTAAVGLTVAWFILPRLATVFASLDIKLPLVTKILIALGSFIAKYGYFVIPLTVIFLVVVGYFIFAFKKTRFLGQRVAMIIPASKKVVQETELARFGYILGTLLEAGLPLLEAVNALAQVSGFKVYQKFYFYLYNNIEDGNTFRQTFNNYVGVKKIIPKTVQQLIIAGEQSGKLPESLIKIGQSFEAKLDITTKNLAIILEPILLFIVFTGVLAVAIAVILPIYSLVGNL